MNTCLFCKIIHREIKAGIVYENDHVLAFKDINPCAGVHILIIPKQHIQNVADAMATHKNLLGEVVLAAKALSLQFQQSDFRLVTNNGAKAGQSVFHLHFHFLADSEFSWPPGVG